MVPSAIDDKIKIVTAMLPVTKLLTLQKLELQYSQTVRILPHFMRPRD